MTHEKDAAGEITELLERWRDGDRSVEDRLFRLVYDELRRIARGYLRHERPHHTLNATSLVHEAFLKLKDQNRVSWQNRSHFYAIAATVMRRALLHYAERRKALKRGGGVPHEPLHEATRHLAEKTPEELIALDEALTHLKALNTRWGQVVEYFYFCDLPIREIADLLDLSPTTVKRDLRFARQWLRGELSASDES